MAVTDENLAWKGWETVKRLIPLAVVLVVGAVLHSARADSITVSSVGAGATRQGAIDAALLQAVEQATGVRLKADRHMSGHATTSTDGMGRASTQVSESFQQEVRQQAGGVVAGFDVVSVDSAASGFVAHLDVTVERFTAPGLPTKDRRRIVVAPLGVATGATAGEASSFKDALSSYLAQTRRFAVLDRDNEAAYRAEMELLKSADVPIPEAVRIGQVLGTDYVVLPKLRQLEAVTESVILPVTGQQVRRTTTSVAADFAVIEIASRQVKWAGRVSRQIEGDREAALRDLASALGGNIVNDIYPLRVVQVLDPRTLVVNQGGETIRVGQTFLANLLGEMAIDPYTKEPLGRAEVPIGTVVITRVDPKLSYGELVSGGLPGGDVEIVLRAAPEETRKASPNTGVRPQW